MGSPRTEPERRPGENQVEVTLSKGFWTGKYEVTQGDWKRIVGTLPGPLTAAGGAGDDFPVYNVNWPEAVEFCRRLSEKAHASGELPKGWEFRLPTEAQWEYACRAGTTTATAFGDKISSKQANFLGDKPYNGAEVGPALNRATKVGSYPAQRVGVTRHARQRRRMVSRLVSHAFAGRHRSRSVERSREQEPHGRLLKIATRQRLYRSWLGLPLGVPTAVRA